MSLQLSTIMKEAGTSVVVGHAGLLEAVGVEVRSSGCWEVRVEVDLALGRRRGRHHGGWSLAVDRRFIFTEGNRVSEVGIRS